MGVSGSGKSTVGELLAAALGIAFQDADDLHPADNIAKMSRGLPLSDADRAPWLALVGKVLAENADAGIVVACSALARRYRDSIRAQAPATRFIYLHAPESILRARIAARAGHFMPASLFESQLATLDPLASTEAGIALSAEAPADAVVGAAVEYLHR